MTGAYSLGGRACGCPSHEGATALGDGNGRRFHFPPVRPAFWRLGLAERDRQKQRGKNELPALCGNYRARQLPLFAGIGLNRQGMGCSFESHKAEPICACPPPKIREVLPPPEDARGPRKGPLALEAPLAIELETPRSGCGELVRSLPVGGSARRAQQQTMGDSTSVLSPETNALPLEPRPA